MSSHQINANEIALVFYQEILSILAINLQVTPQFKLITHPIVDRAKHLVNWNDLATIAPLRSIFDAVNLDPQKSNKNVHYARPGSISDTNPQIPYPVLDSPDLTAYRAEVKNAIESITPDDWQNLSFLSLFLEKYGSCLSFGDADIALSDLARTTAGVATALAQIQMAGLDVETTKFLLIAGDLSGIQSFIYNISSDGALKSLRARSFFLELIVEEIVHQLLEQLQLPRSNVIYAGGGNIYILAADVPASHAAVATVRKLVNDWFAKEYQGKLFLALDSKPIPQADIGDSKFSSYWAEVTQQELAKQKGRKFSEQAQLTRLLSANPSHEPCKVCNRDDVVDLQPLNHLEENSVDACITCRSMFYLGTQLFKSKIISRSFKEPQEDKYRYVTMNFADRPVYYQVWGRYTETIEQAISQAQSQSNPTNILLIDNWQLSQYKKPYISQILLGNYYQRSGIGKSGDGKDIEVQYDGFVMAEELATKAAGIDRVGYLRMDVDNLGQMFAKGLGKAHNLPRLAGLSRQMSYFFKVYLNSLAENRQANTDPIEGFTRLSKEARPDLLFIYAGGDDLFISGAWNQIAEFACDIYQSFRAYTGDNPDITISGGISVNTSKYPLYRAAKEAGDAEGKAKDNGKDSFNLFGETFKWAHWLGRGDEEAGYFNDKNSLNTNIIELTSKLNNPDQIGYSRAFIRNLLILADIRDRKIESLNEQPSSDTKQDLTYYLHLPKLAYALSRLPSSVRTNPNFPPVQQALLNPRSSPYFRAIATWVELLNRK
jgi:CRISPR-associated protein Csm1